MKNNLIKKNVIYQGELTDKNQLINLSETYISVKERSNNTKPVDNKGNDSWIYLFVKYSADPIKIGEFWFKNGTNFQGYYPKGNEKKP
ncbi:hypothetical protein C6H68_16050 [Photorhabdus luminescens]|nr:hypothetical protein C6H68_16050 [Photorhabdus luminescens]